MNHILKGGHVYLNGEFRKKDILVINGRIADIADEVLPCVDTSSYDVSDLYVFPGFVDVHVHLREPGFSYKETIASGTAAAARGGVTTVCAMPNLNPVPDSMETLSQQLEIIRRDARVRVIPYGAITCGEKGEQLSDMEAMAPYVAGFSDDGRGVQSEAMMRKAMLTAKMLGKKIVAHCEDNSLLRGGVVHDGEFARKNGLPGVCSESEWGQIARDIELVRETGCPYHVCHISTKESVEIIRRAKAEGLPVTCETGPQYLLLDDSMIEDHGRFRMNPPIRSSEDREALVRGLCDGTIDVIATDHAPHSAEEKSRGIAKSVMGIVGLETAFPALYTGLVKSGILSLERLVSLYSDSPRALFGLEGGLRVGESADITCFDLCTEYTVDPAEFLSMGKSSPFEGMRVSGKCVLTLYGGAPVWKDEERF